MGDFITTTDITDRYQDVDLIALTNNDDVNASTIDNSVLSTFILDAESVVKGYVQTKYSLPFSIVPAIIKLNTARLTLFDLKVRKGGLTAELQAEYEAIDNNLTKIAEGVITLDTSPGDNAFQTADVQRRSLMVEDDPYFSASNLVDFV